MQQLRVLGRVRLSRSSEESTSIERQREYIEDWAKANRHTVVGWAEDVDVSGSVDPFDTPGLGPWLNHRADEFDAIAVWKLDRLGRNSIKLKRLIGWCIGHGKTVVSTSEGIDISTSVGRLIADVIGFLAEGELEAIRERQRSSRQYLRQNARWHGGKPPYGYRSVKNPGGKGTGWSLEIDPETSVVVRRIVDAALAGYPLTRLAGELTAEGVPPPGQHHNPDRATKGRWTSTALRKMLQSRALLGHVHKTVHATECREHWNSWCRNNCPKETVRDDEARPLQMADPLVTVEEYQRIQKHLDGIKQSRANVKRTKASPLSGVAICEDCSEKLHHDTTKVSKYIYHSYRCRPCSIRVKAELLEAEVEREFLKQLGDVQVRKRVWVPGDSRDAELAEAVSALDELAAAAGRAKSATAKQRLQLQLDALDDRIAELEQAPSREGGWDYVPTGETYGSVWESSDTDQRRDLLVRSGITVSASSLAVNLHIPAEIAGLINGDARMAEGWEAPTTRTVVTPTPIEGLDERLAELFELGKPQ